MELEDHEVFGVLGPEDLLHLPLFYYSIVFSFVY